MVHARYVIVGESDYSSRILPPFLLKSIDLRVTFLLLAMNSIRRVVVSKSAHNPPTAMPIISPTPRPEKNHADRM